MGPCLKTNQPTPKAGKSELTCPAQPNRRPGALKNDSKPALEPKSLSLKQDAHTRMLPEPRLPCWRLGSYCSRAIWSLELESVFGA